MKEELEFDITLEKKNIYDYTIFHTYGTFRGKAFVAVGVISLLLVVFQWQNYEMWNRLILGFIAAYYLCIQPLMILGKIKKLVAIPQFTVPIHYLFHGEEITVRQGEEIVTYRWEDGLNFVNRKHLVYMYVSLREAYIIPKDQANGVYQEVLALAKQHGCSVKAK